MKINSLVRWFHAPVICLLAMALNWSAFAQGTAFTYQGRLSDGGAPANGSYDLTFTIFDAASGPAQISGTLTNFATPVSGGAFTVTLDFGNVFPGAERWLEISVTTNGGGSFATLAPRQPFTATPYAIHSLIAENAFNAATAGTASNLLGTLPAGQLAGTYTNALTLNNPANSFSGDGSGLTGINAWRLAGNAGTTPAANFLGTTDDQPLEFRVFGARALRLEQTPGGSPNFIGGSSANAVTAGSEGATIGGGHANDIGTLSYFTTIGGGYDSHIADGANYAVIGGGRGNYVFANGQYSTVSGGYLNRIAINSESATIAGGIGGDIGASSSYSVLGGGFDNNIAGNSQAANIAGGSLNDIGPNSSYSTISGGEDNNIATNSHHATIAGGRDNNIGLNSAYGAIGGGYANNIDALATNAVIAGGGFNSIGYYARLCAIGGGVSNMIEGSSYCSTIAGGEQNRIAFSFGNTISGGGSNYIASYGAFATIAGGRYNDIGYQSSYSAIGCGLNNSIAGNSHYATIGGGRLNTILTNGNYATIPGGWKNTAAGLAFAAGYNAQATNVGAFVWSDGNGTNTSSTANNSVTFRASGGYRFFTDTGTAGAELLPNATAWSVMSDRNAKKNFAAVDSESVLDKLSRVPVSQWNYKWENDSAVPNIGPMAQDFKAAFFPGRDDTTISTLEFDGVELAAIQGLNRKLEQKQTEITELKARLEKLERLVNEKIGGAK